MTRQEKIKLIRKYRPYLLMHIQKQVPNLVKNPNNATDNDIALYNALIEHEAMCENNPTFKKNFSF